MKLNPHAPIVRYLDQTPALSCPYGDVRRVVTGGEFPTANVHIVKVSAGGEHFHRSYDELYYVLSGEGLIRLAGQDHALRPGAVVAIPAGVAHSLQAHAESELEFVIFGTPGMSVDDFRFVPERPGTVPTFPLLSNTERRRFFEQIDLYPVITSEFCAGRSPVEVLKAIADGGARIVQLREKGLDDRELIQLACEFRNICSANNMLLIINDRIDIALAVAADGVHLGQKDLPIETARIIAPELIYGASSHSLEEALAAQNAGADYVNIGPLFDTKTKTLAMDTLGLEALETIPAQLEIPFTVMGGIKARHIPELARLGATKIAMVTEITQAPDIAAQVRSLREAILGA